MRLLGQFQACFFFFLRTNFECKKAPKFKTNGFHFLKSFCECEKLVPLLFFVRLFVFLLVGFGLVYVFVPLKSFRK